MESFFRYVSYVDYYKRGERIKNVGFLRWKLHNNEHRIELQLKDVFGLQGSYEIQEKNTGKVIGKIKIDKGIGSFLKKFPSLTASGELYIDTINDRLYLCDVEGFLVKLDEDEYLSVPVNLEQEKKTERFVGISKKNEEENLLMIPEKRKEKVQMLTDEKSQEEKQYADSKDGNTDKKIYISEKNDIEEQKLISERNNNRYTLIYECNKTKDNEEESFIENEKKKTSRETEAASENVLIEGIEEKYIEQKHQGQVEKYVDSTSNKKIKIIEPIHEDKWQQLCTQYPQVHPFPGKKAFLSIKPEDFIVLQQEYQKLVHNSFLLHGFYNYGHMILGKLTNDEKAPVYIGVPGVYYEREKQAAQMFGFVGFESTEHPVQAGSYGYYMIEVEI